MNLVDWLLIAGLVVFALAGWHRGFIAGLLSFIGFLGGGLAAALLLPEILDRTVSTDWLRILLLGLGVLIVALVGQFAASILGERLRDLITWRPAQVVDNVAGAALNVFALAVVVWIVASALAYLPVSLVSQQVTSSRVLVALDSLVPLPARNAFGDLRDLVGTTEVPRIFAGLAQVTGPDVGQPSPSSVTQQVDAARDSVVQVTGETPECRAAVSGSGFVVAPGRVLTNAHVVAGVKDPLVRVRQSEAGLPATVVYFDPEVDVAVLLVPGLSSPPLQLATEPAQSGDPAVVAGFPQSGPYRTEPARIRTEVTAMGDDIYGEAGVEREVYALRTTVLPGNSGGPLLRPDGKVLGLVFGADEQAQETGYALTAGELSSALSASGDRRVGTGSCRIRD
ncbi:MAG: MarP family serine protease [Actinomycetales bacterium]|nr:MarP family serine protease [Actinomycetales bacterium]